MQKTEPVSFQVYLSNNSTISQSIDWWNEEMNEDLFHQFLIGHYQKLGIEVDTQEISETIERVKTFDRFLEKKEDRTVDNASAQDITEFSSYLISQKQNSRDIFLDLIRYSLFSGNKEMLVALYELLDGHEVLGNLSNEIAQELGKAQRDQIFNGIELPPLGTPATEKPKITQQLMERLELKVDKETCKNLLSRPLHRLSDKHLRKVREKFLQSKDIDDFLKREHQDIVSLLEQHLKEGNLFFTQEVDKQVVDFVRQDPQIMVGIRRGEKIFTTKIPYMTKQYLNESNEQLKKYHYCHCFWVREAIKSGANEISPTFCYCSAGFKKQFWDAALGQPVKVEVVESILKGDSVCTFVIHLPKEIIDQVDKKD